MTAPSRILVIEDEPVNIQALSARVQVSDTVFQRLQSQFDFEPRGIIELKGRGPVNTYFLNAPKS